MAGILTKNKSTTTIAAKDGIPAVPGKPAVPAVFVTYSKTVCGTTSSGAASGWSGTIALSSFNGEGGGILVNNAAMAKSSYACTSVSYVYREAAKPAVAPIPAVPPTPAQAKANLNLGWTGGANSVQVLEENGSYRFKVLGVVGALLGLSKSNKSTDFNEPTHALYVFGQALQVIESGVKRWEGRHDSGDEYSISRINGVVSYLRGNQLLYRSMVGSAGPVTLDASLYAGGDTVELLDSGNIGAIQFIAREPAFTAGLSRNSIYFRAKGGDLKAVSLPRGNVSFLPKRPLMLMGNRAYSQLGFESKQATMKAGMGVPEPSYALLEFYAPPAAFSLVSLVGGIGGMSLSSRRPIVKAADHPTCEMSFSIGAPLMYAHNYFEANDGYLTEAILLHQDVAPQVLAFATFNEQMAVLAVVQGGGVGGAVLSEGVSALVQAATFSIMGAALEQSVGVALSGDRNRYDAAGKIADPAKCWVINYDTGATTMYDGFDFTRLFEYQGRYYGERDGKAYLLDGDSDDGEQIAAFVAFGKRNFGTSAKKRIPYLYAGMASTGELILRATTPQGTYIYRAKRVSSELQAQRFDLGRGLNATFYEFEVFNEAGADFSLNSIEFTPIVTSRRI